MTKTMNNNTQRMIRYYYGGQIGGFVETTRADVEEWALKRVDIYTIYLIQDGGEAYLHFNGCVYNFRIYQTWLSCGIIELLYQRMNHLDDLTAVEMCKILLEGDELRVAYDCDDGIDYDFEDTYLS